MKCIYGCTRCPLHKYQIPAVEKVRGKIDVFFVGLSAVLFKSEDEKPVPFPLTSRSGKFVHEILDDLPDVRTYKTNLVKCAPVQGKSVRYPDNSEMESCMHNFILEIEKYEPKKIVLFSGQVFRFVWKELNVKGETCPPLKSFPRFFWKGVEFMACPHPSYVLIYGRKNMKDYKETLIEFARG
jgi:DNA polymerase